MKSSFLLLNGALLCMPILLFGQFAQIRTSFADTTKINRIDFNRSIVSTLRNYKKPPELYISAKKFKEKRIPGSLVILTDQDFLFDFLDETKNEDRNYTQGTAFTYSHPNLMNFFLFWPQRKFDKWLDFERYGSSISLAGTAFTPLELDSVKPIIGDRPFSFLLYISTSATVKNIQHKLPRFHSLTINYGLFGTNIGYAFQTYAHKQLVTGRSKDPKGWNTQISKGGAPTLLVDYNRFQSLLEYPKRKGTIGERGYFDLGWNLGGSVGYYHRAYTGLYMRAGLLKKENQARWNNGWSVLGGASYELEAAPTPKKVTRSFETFFYTKVNFTAMLRNSMLVGQIIKESEYEMKYAWTKKLLAEWEWGFVFAWEKQKSRDRGPRTRSAFIRAVYRTPEFDSGIFPVRNHYFASAGIMGPLITY